MITSIARYVVILFGFFFIAVGILMLFNPEYARKILRKAGSTNFINYAEITLRILPALALILYAPQSKYPMIFKLIGWFMFATSMVLYFIPREKHHRFSLKSADILKPGYLRIIAPFSVLIGSAIIYGAV